ncbi:MAG TPA: enoyl-CoA hydratase-related protein [Pyrinomonadaceae bacterium]|nr:enoyl-CoA hydratase-related protein [Pyrinomonadaceae bacterium]
MSNEDQLVVTLERGVKRITFNRPERRNAVTLEMFEAFAEAVEKSDSDGTRVVVITGAGEAFCAGLDLSAVAAGDLARLDVAATVRRLINPPILRMRSSPVPFIARVHGPAAGIGFSYVLASDLRVGSPAASFGQTFIRVGLMPDGGSTYFLSRLVGPARAFELMATGATLSADDALRLGVLNRVVPVTELDAACDELADALARAPQPALAHVKTALSRAERDALAAALDFEAEGQAESFASPDFAEGVTAFMQKRAPEFGRRKG